SARRYYYKCAHDCGARYVPVRAVEAAAEPLIVARLEDLREELARQPVRAAPALDVVGLAERRTRLQRKRERFLEAFADEHMTRDELRDAMAKLDAEALRLDGEEAAAR